MTSQTFVVSAVLACVALSGSANAATNLITDGGFESAGIIPNAIAGFTSSGASGPDFAATSVSDGQLLPEEGGHFAALGSYPGLNFLSQTFSDVAGQSLLLSYYLASADNGPNEFQTIFDNITLADVTVPDTTGVYQKVSFTVTATGSDTLTFASKDSPDYIALDNISVTPPMVSAAPEPSTWLLLVSGVGLMGSVLRRRRAADVGRTPA